MTEASDPEASKSESIVETPTVESLYSSLREQILNGDLPEGTALSQVQLARRFGVNRTPLREALRMLQREGLVEAHFNRRVRVAPLTTAELEGLYAERILDEALGVALTVPTMGDDDVEGLEDLNRTMHKLASEWRLEEWEEANREFHARLVGGAGPHLTARIAELSHLARRYRRALANTGSRGAEGLAQGEADHEAIVSACEARDGTLASQRVARHLARTALNLIAVRDPAHDPVAIRAAQRLVGTPER